MKLRIVGGTDHMPQPGDKDAAASSSIATVRRASFRLIGKQPSTTVGNNRCLRKFRREAWRKADAARRYWEMRLKFEDEIAIARINGIPEGRLHPPQTPEDRCPILDSYRAAEAKQMLTPAPNMAAVHWKQVTATRYPYSHLKEADKKRLNKLIADDLAFLKSHAVRKPRRPARKGQP